MEKWVRKSQEVSMLLIGADVGKDEGTELSEEASLLVILV
jgi:hypothetical protein